MLTEGQQNLELGVGLLQRHDSFVEAGFPVLGLVVALETAQLALLEPAESIDDVSAEIGQDVLGHKLAVSCAVLRPVGVVANHLHKNKHVNARVY